MNGVNKVILLGNLGRDPEVRYLENGKSVANFSIATSETYKDKSGEKVTNTEWHNIVMWSPLADIADKYLKKGSKVYVSGKMVTRSYDKDGDTRYITEVLGRELIMLGGNEGNNSTRASTAAPSIPEYTSDVDDDLPF